MFDQRTIKSPVKFSGIGLHSGKVANVRIVPAEENSGIVIKRIDIAENNEIAAIYSNVTEVLYSTKLSNEHGVFVNTIEHLMAAIFAMKISNLIIEMDAEEMPIMDGSSQGFIFLIECVGIKKQKSARKFAKILNKIEIEKSEYRKVSVEPNDSFAVNFVVKNDSMPLINGEYFFDATFQSFINDISLARTYCNFQEIEKLKSMNLAQGGSLQNAIVVNNNEVLNEGGLNYANEFARHKILDLIGDVALSEYYIIGKFDAVNSGHELNNVLMKKIFENPENYEIL